MKIIYENNDLIIYDKTHIYKDRYYVEYKTNEENFYTNMLYIERNIYNKKIKYKQLSIFD